MVHSPYFLFEKCLISPKRKVERFIALTLGSSLILG